MSKELSTQEIEILNLYEREGYQCSDIAAMLSLTEEAVKHKLYSVSRVYRQNYVQGIEDIPDDLFDRIKMEVMHTALDRDVPANVKLKAGIYVWDRKRPQQNKEADFALGAMAVLTAGMEAAAARRKQVFAQATEI